jgi:hypothetical protein
MYLAQCVMGFKPKEKLTEAEVHMGLHLVIFDGLTSEAMTTLAGGAFLVAFSILMGASNFQIGLLASLPTFTNIFQLVSIWLVRRYNNRRAIAVFCSLLARVPLIVIGILAFVIPDSNSVDLVLSFLFFFYLFGSIAGPSWNAWMKDLVPEKMLGAYFSKRSRYSQILNVVMSLALAFALDYVKKHYPEYELVTYGVMFVTAGLVGITGALILSKVQEPRSLLAKENLFRLIKRPLEIEISGICLFLTRFGSLLLISQPRFLWFS